MNGDIMKKFVIALLMASIIIILAFENGMVNASAARSRQKSQLNVNNTNERICPVIECSKVMCAGNLKDVGSENSVYKLPLRDWIGDANCQDM